MLGFFRQRGLSSVLYGAIIIATILTFVIEFRPTASQRTASLKQTCVAEVRGRCLDPKDFGAAYRMLMPSRSAQMSRRMNLKRVALDGLIERELLDDEAKRLGLTVTEDELTDQLYDGFVRVSVPAADPALAQTIFGEMYQSYARAGLVSQDVAQAHFNDRDAAIPVDFRNPKTKTFDMKVYERQIRNISNRSTAEFREGQERELLAAKMRDLVRDPVRVSEAETWQEYDRRYTTATVTWIPVKESWAARWAVDAGRPAVDAWAKDHKTEVDKAFEERAKEDAPKAGHLRHILVKLPYGATDDEKAVALGKLSWAAARIRSGEPFAEMAREMSDDPGSAAQGGDVGDKTDGFVPPFKAAADALKAGETTPGAVETQFGYHLIMRDDPSKAAEVNAQLRQSLPLELYVRAQAPEAAKAVANKIAEQMRSGRAAGESIDAAIAPYVKAGNSETLRVLVMPAGAADAGAADAGAATTGAAGNLASPREKNAGPVPHGEKNAKDASGGKTKSLPVKRFDAASDVDRPQAQTSAAFNRGGDPFEGLSPEGATRVMEFAFGSKDGTVMGEPVRMTDGFAVVAMKEHKLATRDEFEKNRATLEQELLRAKRDEALSQYVTRLRSQAKASIRIDSQYVEESRPDAGPGPAEDDEDQY